MERFQEGRGARNHYIGNGDPGALALVAGVGILKVSENRATVEGFIEFLRPETALTYFDDEIKRYPVAAGIQPKGDLPPLEPLNRPDVDLGSLSDLEGTPDLLREGGHYRNCKRAGKVVPGERAADWTQCRRIVGCSGRGIVGAGVHIRLKPQPPATAHCIADVLHCRRISLRRNARVVNSAVKHEGDYSDDGQ